MKAIIIGAGRGRRLEHLTEDIPKPLVPIVGRPMLDSVLEALAAGGFDRSGVVYVCGYKAEVIQQAYPELDYVLNAEWASNNILLSLLCAREQLAGGFVSTYADIVYRPEAVRSLMASPHDITLVCDTEWRRRYRDRSQHPESDGEKVRAEGDRLLEVSRHIPAEQAAAEFIGVTRLTSAGAASFLAAYDELAERHGLDQPFHQGRSLRKAYLIDLLEHMRAAGEPMHCTFIEGGYMEIDTTEDAAMAETWWR